MNEIKEMQINQKETLLYCTLCKREVTEYCKSCCIFRRYEANKEDKRYGKE